MADIVRRINISVSGAKAEADIKRVDKSMVSLGRSTDSAVTSMGNLSAGAAAVISALASNKILEYADAWTIVNNKLANSIRLNEDLTEVTDRVFNIAQRTRSSLDATAELYSKLERSTRAYGTSAEDVAKVTETINKSLIISGASAQGAESAILQLSQGLASGALRGEEFNSVNENGNRLVLALADSLGVEAGQLKNLAAQGALTTQVVVDGILKQTDAIENEYTKTISTFSQATQEANNNLTKFIGESTTVQGVVGVAGDAVVSLSESMDALVDVSIVFATILGGRMVPAIYAQIAAQTALIKSQLTATTTTNAMGVVISRTTVTMNVATVATRALSGAMALLGGPIGILATVVLGIIAFNSAADDASDISKSLGESVDKTTDAFRGLSREQAKSQLATVSKDIEETKARIEELNTSIDTLSGNAQTFTDLDDAVASGEKIRTQTNEVNELNKTLDELNAKQSTLQGISTAPETSTNQGGGVASPTVENEKFITQQLNDQLIAREAQFELYTQRILSLEEGSTEQLLLISEAAQSKQITDLEAANQTALRSIEARQTKELKDTSLSESQKQEIKAQTSRQLELQEALTQQKITEIFAAGEAERAQILVDGADQTTAGDVRVAAEIEETENLRNELANRQMIFDSYTQQIYALEEGSFGQRRLLQQQNEEQQILAAQEASNAAIEAARTRQATALEDESLTNQQRMQINAEFDNQLTLQEQLKQQRLTEIEAEGADSRQTIREAEKQAAIATTIDLGNNLMSAFDGQSKSLFELGKVTAIAGTVVKTYESATSAYSAMAGIPVVGPALGAAAAAAAVVGGLANVKKIQATKYNSKSGAASSSYSSAAGGGATTGTGSATGSTAAPPTQSNQRFIEIRGLGDEQVLTGGQVKDILNDALQNDDDIIVAVSNGQASGLREGVL